LAQPLRRLDLITQDLFERVQPGDEELQVVLEELRVAEEELRSQNEQLLASHQALERERTLFRDLFDHAPVGYLVTDRHGRIHEVNQAAVDMLGREQTTLQMKAIFVLIPTDQRRAVRQALLKVTGSGVSRTVEAVVQRPDETPVPVEMRLSRSPNGHDRVRWLLLDLTERKRAEAAESEKLELQKANEVKDHLMSLISHELRTPLTMVLGNAELLVRHRQTLSPEEVEQLADTIQRESRQLHTMIENMLALNRPAGGVEMEPVLLQHTLPEIVDPCRRALQGREVRVSVKPDLPPVSAERGYVQQIVENYLTNADKYSPPGEPLEVCALRHGETAVVEVRDRGRGIPSHERHRVFDPFFRSEEVEGRVRGVGLGLTVCRLLAEAQGGKTWVRPREGGGSVFGLSLPLFLDDPDVDEEMDIEAEPVETPPVRA
jgi:PAS domain S-box-containing protein